MESEAGNGTGNISISYGSNIVDDRELNTVLWCGEVVNLVKCSIKKSIIINSYFLLPLSLCKHECMNYSHEWLLK